MENEDGGAKKRPRIDEGSGDASPFTQGNEVTVARQGSQQLRAPSPPPAQVLNIPLGEPPCAACKSLRRKCTRECIFLPYFPRDDPEKFARVHKVFGASNVAKMLQLADIPPQELGLHQREDAVASLEYEAQARVQDPVYGCVGILCVLQRQVAALRQQLASVTEGGEGAPPVAQEQRVVEQAGNGYFHEVAQS